MPQIFFKIKILFTNFHFVKETGRQSNKESLKMSLSSNPDFSLGILIDALHERLS